MWKYNYSYLSHSDHKYIDKTYKNGRWVYTYPDDGKGGIIRKDISSDSYSKKKASWGLNPKAMEKALVGTRLQGRRDSKNRNKILTKKSVQEYVQKIKDINYSIDSELKKVSQKAAKQAEEERRKSSDIVDINNALRATSSSYRDVYDSLEALSKIKKENLRQQDFDGMARDVYEKIKKYQKSQEDLIKVYENAGKPDDVEYLKKDLEERIELFTNKFKKYTQ